LIYYVIPRELADKYYEEFKKRFEGVEGVEVIVDRRESERRDGSPPDDPAVAEQRMLRDRRRRRVSGSFPDV
jgi:hypothetical protein